MTRFFFLWISILSPSSSAAGHQRLHNGTEQGDPQQAPCTRSESHAGLVTVDCSNGTTGEELRSTFNESSWRQFWKFKMDRNTNVEELPEGALQNVSFERMNIRNSVVKTIHPSALLSSAETLSVLEIFSCHMESFPFDVLPRLTNLRALILPLNRFASVPPLRSRSLEELFLMWNKIMRLEKDGWATPKLRKLVLGDSQSADETISFVMPLSNEDRRSAVISLHEAGKSPAEIFRLLQNNGYNRNFIKRTIQRFLETNSTEDRDGAFLLHIQQVNLASNTSHYAPMAPSSRKSPSNGKSEGDGEDAREMEGSKDGNPFSEFPSDVINALERLEEFSCAECNLGPNIPSGFINFRSESLKVVNLAWNKIVRLEPGAITGMTPNTYVDLQHNNIATFPKESFQSILQVLSRGNGILNVNSFSPEGGKPAGNTIPCDCHAEWLTNDRLFKSIGGRCRNGIEFHQFRWDELECLQPCPYSCVQIGLFPLCNPETVILSKVEGCRHQELCCQPNFPSIAATTKPRPTGAIAARI
ncbi:unnamed protein product, partial [Darwinula stevensoni]